MKVMPIHKRGISGQTCLSVLSICLLPLALNPAQAEEIKVAGSSTVRPVVEKAAQAFTKENPGVKIVVGGGGSSHGVKSVAAGEVVIGMASRNLKQKEKETWTDLVPVTVGMDGICIIVHAKNPVTKVTKQQIQDIYTGKISNWKELGGDDAEILLISKEEGRSTLDLFLKYFDLEAKEVGEGKQKVMVHRAKPAKDADPQEAPKYSKVTARLIGPNREAIAAVSIKKNAIAYSSIGTAQEVAAKGGRIRLVELDGVPATTENVANETYPLRRPLNLFTKGAPSGMTQAFIDFLTSQQGQQIVSKLEFIAVKNT